MLEWHHHDQRFGRRRILAAGGAGMLGLSLPRMFALEPLATLPVRAKSVIFLMLFGGPSQLETFDMKPDAPSQIRGPMKPIGCRTPELLISEGLPRLANISDKFSVIRTMSHTFNDHSGGAHYLQTGRRWHIPIGGGFTPTPNDWPSYGSVLEYHAQQQGEAPDLPSYAVIPNSLGRIEQQGQYPRPGEHPGWLGQRYAPLTTQIDKRGPDDNPYWRDCTDEELTFQIQGLRAPIQLDSSRQLSRRSLLEQFEDQRKKAESKRDYDSFRERALALVTSEKTRQALDITREPASIRDRYGRHLFGQATLMARRLVETGVRFVTVHYEAIDGYSWDSHRNSDDVIKHLLPTTDQAVSALLEELDDRGLLDETLVICTGEMGRTPKANSTWGRDHWSTLFSCLIAGAGVHRGSVYGQTDKDAAYAIEKVVSPENLAATIYYALGIDPEIRLPDRFGRPVQIIEGDFPPVTELFGSI